MCHQIKYETMRQLLKRLLKEPESHKVYHIPKKQKYFEKTAFLIHEPVTFPGFASFLRLLLSLVRNKAISLSNRSKFQCLFKGYLFRCMNLKRTPLRLTFNINTCVNSHFGEVSLPQFYWKSSENAFEIYYPISREYHISSGLDFMDNKLYSSLNHMLLCSLEVHHTINSINVTLITPWILLKVWNASWVSSSPRVHLLFFLPDITFFSTFLPCLQTRLPFLFVQG